MRDLEFFAHQQVGGEQSERRFPNGPRIPRASSNNAMLKDEKQGETAREQRCGDSQENPRTRDQDKGLVQTMFAGDYHSVFKGRGMN